MNLSRIRPLEIAVCSVCASIGVAATNIPVSTLPPGGLDPANTPQICLFTFDDTVTSNGYPIIQSALTNHLNPNGSPIQATFYVNTDNGQYFNARLVEQLYAQGHEIGVHTMTHTTSTNTTVETWRREIVGCRKVVSDLSLVPKEEIVGFRAPYLAFSQGSFDILAEAGFRYDTSIREATDNGGLSSSNSTFIWPYTLDNGVQQECDEGDCPEGSYPGLFEVPLWVLNDTNGETLATMDVDFVNHPEWSMNDVMTLLTNNFMAHYNGNRAPFGVFMHATWTNQWFVSEPWHSEVVSDFIGWALDHPDVWFVSTKALLDFMEDPQTATNAYTFPPFITSTNHHALSPNDQVTERAYPDYGWKRIVSAVDHPLFWPHTSTFYGQWQLVEGGSSSSGIASWGDQFEGHINVSNNTDQTIYRWEATFHVEHGEITNFYGTPYTVTNDLYTAYSHEYNMPIPPHAAYTSKDTGNELPVGFGGGLDGTNEATISPIQLTFYTGGREADGGHVSNWIHSTTNFAFDGFLDISNSTDSTIHHWDVEFTVHNGEVTNMTVASFAMPSNTTAEAFTMKNGVCSVNSHGHRMPLEPGESYCGPTNALYFQGSWDNTNAPILGSAQLVAYTPTMPIPAFTNMGMSSSNMTLAWEEAAVGYSIESRTNLIGGDWNAITTIYTRTEWTSAVPDSASPTFYRIRSVY